MLCCLKLNFKVSTAKRTDSDQADQIYLNPYCLHANVVVRFDVHVFQEQEVSNSMNLSNSPSQHHLTLQWKLTILDFSLKHTVKK